MHRPDSLLPPVITHADYALLRTRGDVWLQVMQIICQRHGLAHEDLKRFGDGTDPADGSCVAFATGEHHVIKLFPPYQKRLYRQNLSSRNTSSGSSALQRQRFTPMEQLTSGRTS